MRKLGAFAFVVGLAVLANAGLADVGLASDGTTSTHDQAAGSSGQADSMMATGTPRNDLAMPPMDAARGRMLFASKGCVICHSINGVGGEDAPALDDATMGHPMNPFDFAAKMWRGAEAMIALQQEEFGEQIDFNGQDLADIIAFVHSAKEQKKFSEEDAPLGIRVLMRHIREEANSDSE